MKYYISLIVLAVVTFNVLCGCSDTASAADGTLAGGISSQGPETSLEDWDPRFAARFDLDQASADRLKPGLQTVEVQGEKNGVQLRIGQVLQETESQGKEMIHVALDVTFPVETVFPERLQEEFAERHAAPTPEPLLLLPKKQNVQSLEEMDQLALQFPQGYISQLCSVDWEAKELCYLLSFTLDEAPGAELPGMISGYTLVLGALSWENKPLFVGPVSLSWDVK